MAWEGAWPSIAKHGLLSTEALLDLFECRGSDRNMILRHRRPESITITHPRLGMAVIRDQKPIDDTKLARCLTGGMAVSEWYALLNSKVFFWTTQERLFKLVCAAPYRSHRHCILTLDSRSLVSDYFADITFAPINSGATFTDGTLRGFDTFTPFDRFPYDIYRAKGRKATDVFVELTVSCGVNDILKYILSVNIMQQYNVIEELYSI